MTTAEIHFYLLKGEQNEACVGVGRNDDVNDVLLTMSEILELDDDLDKLKEGRGEVWDIHEFYPSREIVAKQHSLEDIVGFIELMFDYGIDVVGATYHHFLGEGATAEDVRYNIESYYICGGDDEAIERYMSGSGIYDNIPDELEGCIDWIQYFRNQDCPVIEYNGETFIFAT